MKTIRKNVFETNSSSTHAICIAKESNNMDIPEKIEIDLSNYEFGWEFNEIYGYNSKLAYILIGILDYNDIVEASTKVKDLLLILKEFGVKSVKIVGMKMKMYSTDFNCPTYFDCYDGYVDHSDELSEFIDIILQDENLLKRYLFDGDSFIATGNDNSYEDVIDESKIEKTHEIFWKGN